MKTIYVFLALLLLLMYIVTTWASSFEGFEDGSGETVVYEDVAKIYDATYASIYDMLWHPNERLQYEQVSMHDIALAEKAVSDIHVADLCCGTAPHSCWFKNLGIDYEGIDISEDMIAQARKNCPKASFEIGDVLNVHLFPQKSKTHCLMLGFSIYEFPNAKVISDNVQTWLQPGGYFVVHMVDPDKFDPLLDLSSPFAAFSLQKYSLDRQTDSTVFFDQFKYLGKFKKEKNDDSASYDETFIYYDPASNNGIKYRENKNKLYMPSKERLINIIKTSGFRFVESVDLVRCGKEYQYLVYFQK